MEVGDDQYAASQKITAPLIALIVQQRGDLGNVNAKAQRVKTLLRQERQQCQAHLAEDLQRRLPPQLNGS